MRKFIGLLCENIYRFSKKSVFVITKNFNIHTIRIITFVVTSRCNALCKMCDIWRINKNIKDMPFNKFEAMLNSKSLKRIRTFGVTGGEPFVKKDLHKFYNLIKQKFPSKKIIFSTNGLLEKDITKFLERIDDKSYLNLVISLDSIKMLDNIRGVKNSFKKILSTINSIKSNFPEVDIIVKFTITPWNYSEIINVYNFSKKENVGFFIKSIDNLSNYTTTLNYKTNEQRFSFDENQKEEIIKQLIWLRHDQLKRLKFRDSAFTKELIGYFSQKNYVLSNCTLPYYSVFITQNGDVYLCRNLKPVGNIYQDDLSQMWNSKSAQEVRYSKCNSCVSHYGYYNSLI